MIWKDQVEIQDLSAMPDCGGTVSTSLGHPILIALPLAPSPTHMDTPLHTAALSHPSGPGTQVPT